MRIHEYIDLYQLTNLQSGVNFDFSVPLPIKLSQLTKWIALLYCPFVGMYNIRRGWLQSFAWPELVVNDKMSKCGLRLSFQYSRCRVWYINACK